MLIILDNAESILDPQLTDGQEIYGVVEELSQFTNICLLITSRITTIPLTCDTLDVPTLPIEAARDTFCRIYKPGGRPDSIDDILKQLDFHPLSITLLATVAHQNKWDANRLMKEWERRHTGVLQMEHNRSLGATIELSLSSPMFKGLGPDARELLGVIAFFPQGLNEDNVDWLFPTIPDMATILDKFCMLSLTYRSGGFVTMLVPLRDYLCPKDPLSSPLLCTTKESYFVRLSARPDHWYPGTEETKWIMSEDVNVEHLLNVLTLIDANSDSVWRACAHFTDILYWHKPRQTVLATKMKQLSDNHHLKSYCLLRLAWLLYSVGSTADGKRLLDHSLKFERERGDHYQLALTLATLCSANLRLGLLDEGIKQAKEALEIFGHVGDIGKQGYCLGVLASLFHGDSQLEAAVEVASRAIKLLQEEGEEFQLCQSHQILGNAYHSKGKREEAIHHFETALGIASRFNWYGQLSRAHCSLARLFCGENKFDDAQAHIEQAKSHVVANAYYLGLAMELQARIYHQQHRVEDATPEALCALEMFEKLGALRDADNCRALLRDIEQTAHSQDTPMVSFREPYCVSHPLTLPCQLTLGKPSVTCRPGKHFS